MKDHKLRKELHNFTKQLWPINRGYTVTNSSIGLIYALKKFLDTNYNVKFF